MESYRYVLINRRTEETVGRFNDLQRARRKRDKLDNEYGGYIHHIREIESQRNML